MATGTKRQAAEEAGQGRQQLEQEGGREQRSPQGRRGAVRPRRNGSGRRQQQQQGVLQKLPNVDAEQLARGLGWFSLGLGLAEVLAPRAVARITGVRTSNAGLIRLLGLREIAHGVGIFAQGGVRPRPSGRASRATPSTSRASARPTSRPAPTRGD